MYNANVNEYMRETVFALYTMHACMSIYLELKRQLLPKEDSSCIPDLTPTFSLRCALTYSPSMILSMLPFLNKVNAQIAIQFLVDILYIQTRIFLIFLLSVSAAKAVSVRMSRKKGDGLGRTTSTESLKQVLCAYKHIHAYTHPKRHTDSCIYTLVGTCSLFYAN